MNYQRFKTLGLAATLLIVNFLTMLWLQSHPISTAWASALGQDAPPETVTAAAADIAAIPIAFSYQGTLRLADGSLPTGLHKITLRIFDNVTGGTELHTETFDNTAVRNGNFSVVVGDAKAIGAAVFDNANLYISIAVGTDPEMLPRQRLFPVPWAMQAGQAITATTLFANASVNGLTTTGLTATGPVAMNADATVKAFREIGDAAGNKTPDHYDMSLRRYTLEAKDGGAAFNSVPVDDAILQQLCADEDGCTLRLGLREYALDLAGTGVVAGFHPTHFSLGADTNGRRVWRAEGDDFNGDFFFFTRADKDQGSDSPVTFTGCNLTDGTFKSGVDLKDTEMGFSLFNSNAVNVNSEMTCVLTIDD